VTTEVTEIAGYRVVSSNFLGDYVQYRKPRSKKRRIRRKWSARPSNWRFVPSGKFLVDNSNRTMYAHPDDVEALKRALPKEQKMMERNLSHVT
jgi:hypothetical protein